MTIEEIQKHALELMEAAGVLTIQLSENEEDYDLRYLQTQLAKCSSYGERLADMMARMAQLKVLVLQGESRASNLFEDAQLEAEISTSENLKPVARRNAIVKRHSLEEKREFQRWKILELVVREARDEVCRRSDIVKRLDSDLRLHEKILAAKITAGAMGLEDLTGDPRHRGATREVTPTERAMDGDTSGDVEMG